MAITKLPSSNAPGEALRAVSPHASDDLPISPCRALYVGTAGDVTVVALKDSSPVTFANVLAGTILPVACVAVRSSTTADDIVAIY